MIWQGNHSGTAASAETVAAEEHFVKFENIRREAFLESSRTFDDESRAEIDVSLTFIYDFREHWESLRDMILFRILVFGSA